MSNEQKERAFIILKELTTNSKDKVLASAGIQNLKRKLFSKLKSICPAEISSRQIDFAVVNGNFLLAFFPSCDEAVKWAFLIQKYLPSPEQTPLLSFWDSRLAIHFAKTDLAKQTLEQQDLALAVELRALCQPGRICISQAVLNHLTSLVDFRIIPLTFLASPAFREQMAYELSPIHQEIPVAYSLAKDSDAFDSKANGVASKQPLPSIANNLQLQAQQSAHALLKHFCPYLFANTAITTINIATGVSFPFCLFVWGGWGLGLAMQAANTLSKQLQARQAQMLPDLTGEAADVFKDLWKEKAALLSHLTSYLSVNGFLVMISFILSLPFPWLFLPAIFWGIGFFSHLIKALTKIRFLGRKLKLLCGGRIESIRLSRSSRLNSQLQHLKNSILKQLKDFKTVQPHLEAEFKPLLDKFISNFQDLKLRYQEVCSCLDSISLKGLETELKALRQKKSQATSSLLKEEYAQTIEALAKQMQNYKALHNQKEIIELRLTKALSNLKQLKLNLIRGKNLSTLNTSSAFHILAQRAEELSDYLQDLNEAYKELS